MGTQNKQLSAEFAFKLHSTYGFPIELTVEIAKEKGWTVDVDGFYRLMAEHRAKSGKFKISSKSKIGR